MILKKLVVICLTRTGHCPKVKKKKNIIKTVYHAFVYLGIQAARNKLGKHIKCPCTQSEIKVFAVSPRRSLGANTRVKRARVRAHRLVYGVCGRKSEERSFQLCSYPLWAMREEIKKQKREKERTKEFEANIKHNICIFYLVVRFRMVSFRGQRKLGPLPGTVESCKCFHQYSRIVALQP